MNAEGAPLDLVSTAVGSTRLSFESMFFLLFAGIWASTWAYLVEREVRERDFGLFALPLGLWLWSLRTRRSTWCTPSFGPPVC